MTYCHPILSQSNHVSTLARGLLVMDCLWKSSEESIKRIKIIIYIQLWERLLEST